MTSSLTAPFLLQQSPSPVVFRERTKKQIKELVSYLWDTSLCGILQTTVSKMHRHSLRSNGNYMPPITIIVEILLLLFVP